MEFDIILNLNGQKYKMHVKRVSEGDAMEKFEVSGGGKVVVLQTNYHFIKRMKQRKSADWKIISGEVKNGAAFALTVREIERYFNDNPELPPRKGS